MFMFKKYVLLFSVLYFLAIARGVSFSNDGDATDAREIELGKKVAIQVEKKWERISDPAKTARLNMLLQRLTPMLRRDLPYEIRLIREDSPNAFSLPGGTIFITTGMLDFTHSDSEIAAILAHELVHADRKHVLIQVARNQKISLVALAIMVASKGQTVPMVLTNIAQITIANSYSRDLEREADIEGINLLVSAGFSPSSMVTVMEGLSEEELKHPYVDPGIYRDHPDISERILYQIEHIRAQGWALERKRPLNVLRCHIASEKGYSFLLIDKTLILRVRAEKGSLSFLRDISRKLENQLQLEMAPYDIQVIQVSGSSKALRVGNAIVISEPVPGDMFELSQIRDRIITALLDAQSVSPTTDFMK